MYGDTPVAVVWADFVWVIPCMPGALHAELFERGKNVEMAVKLAHYFRYKT